MVKISIISLIYCSSVYADWIYDSVRRFTPMIATGDAEFFFIANDPTEDVLNHLKEKKYPFYLNRNEHKTDGELFRMGYGKPEYIRRVYQGFNEGIRRARGEVVVLLNSDNCASPDWLENLLKYLGPDKIVTSQLVERSHPKHGVFPGAYHAEFGNHPSNFDEAAFLAFVERFKMTGIVDGGSYMPCAVYRENGLKVGLYPEGNIAGKTFNDIHEHGDEYFFHKLSDAGISHVTALDSLSYHFKEGEMDDLSAINPKESVAEKSITSPGYLFLKPVKLTGAGGARYIAFDQEFFIIREFRLIVRHTRIRIANLKSRLGKIKNSILKKNA